MFNNSTHIGFLIIFLICLPFLSISFQIYSENRFQTCNFTHFVYQNNISLARQDELNRTFQKIAQKVTNLINVTSIIDSKTSYQIFDVIPAFKFSYQNQKAQILGNDTVVYYDGQLKIQISFKWKKITQQKQELNGSGKVQIQSDLVIYATQIAQINNQFRYELFDWMDISFNNDMNWVQLMPLDTQAWDRSLIYRAINNNSNEGTLKSDIEQKIKTYFTYYLRQFLNDPADNLSNDHFEYVWIDPVQQRGNFTIQFQKKLRSFQIDRKDIETQYQMRIKNWPNWKCGQIPTTIPLNPQVYGGSQQFISISFFQNVLRYAIQKGRLDAVLQRKYWQSDLFNFTAGQLFPIIPKLSEKFNPNQEIKGNCKVSSENFKLIFVPNYFLSQNDFQLYLNLKCELSIQKQKIAQFNLQMWLMIQGVPSRDFLEFKLNYLQHPIASYEKVGQYQVQDSILADKMIAKSLKRIHDNSLFGSGWPLYPKRDQPQFFVLGNSALIYDKSTSPINNQ